MGGTTNATDNFNIPTETEVVAHEATAHVHGPGCGHDHTHDAPNVVAGKYANVDQIPELDLVASFNANNEGPIWRKTPQEYLTNIAFQAAAIEPGGVKVCFVNNEAYKFLLSNPRFRHSFEPTKTIELQKKGVLGLFESKVIVASDALWEPADQVTMHKAMYFCDEVTVGVTEVLIETAPPAAEVAEDVINKEKGRCINCLDTGLVAGDLDQTCGCPAGALQTL